MEASVSDASLPKILLKFEEFQRLKHIEKKFQELEIAHNLSKNVPSIKEFSDEKSNPKALNQTGLGINASASDVSKGK